MKDLVEGKNLRMEGFESGSKGVRQMCLGKDDFWIKQQGVGRTGRWFMESFLRYDTH